MSTPDLNAMVATALDGAREHNLRAEGALQSAENAIMGALHEGHTPDTEEGQVALVAMTRSLEVYVRERTLAKVTTVLAHAAQTFEGDSITEAVYTAAQKVYASGFIVRECKADSPEYTASLALAGFEFFNKGIDPLAVTPETPYHLARAACGAADDKWSNYRPPHGWAMRCDITPEGVSFHFDAEAEVPEEFGDADFEGPNGFIFREIHIDPPEDGYPGSEN